MKVLGIIAEYNPFHNGHLFHLEESKKKSGADVCVAVMSGNFTQRGDPAIMDKWTRARIAVDCGVSLVLELPFVYACNNSEYFAKGGIQILNGLSCVDFVSFGSESGDIGKLREAAEAVLHESPAFKSAIRESLDGGASFPKARAFAVRAAAGEETAALLDKPNNILAVEYLKQLSLSKSKIEAFTVKRQGPGYNSAALGSGGLASAAAIREGMKAGGAASIKDYVPEDCNDVINKVNIDINGKVNALFSMILARILTESGDSLEEIFSAGEGLGNKLKKAVRDSENMERLISNVKSKRYARTRIQRLLIHALFDLRSQRFYEIAEGALNYARVLAFDSAGARLLKRIRASGAGFPVITNINRQVHENDEINAVLKFDILASDLYNLISGFDLWGKSDYVIRPYHKIAQGT